MAEESYRNRPDWDLRPWLLAGLGAVAGLIIHFILGDGPFYSNPPGALKTASVAFVGSLAVLIAFTLERERWQWSVIFSFVAALAIGLILYWNGAPDQWSGGDGWRVVCIFLSVAIAAPLFQAARDQGARRFPYVDVHDHALTNVVIWCAGWAFVGIVFLLTLLLSELFALIKITLIKDLLDENWFIRVLMGASFGAAIGILREQDRIVRVLQRVIVAVLSVLAPVLGAGLLLFLLSLPFTGLSALWDATKATTPILLSCVIGAVILANAVIGNGEEQESRFPPLRYGAMALGLAMLPLAVIAAISTGLRIGQYGFTPDRLWALVFVIVACAFGLAYLVSLVRGRHSWATYLRPANLNLAFGLCALALFLALPILSFNAISTRDQVARLESGKIMPEKFDWAALRYDFGEPGKAAVDRLARSQTLAIAKAAKTALATENRWDLAERQTNAVRAERVRRTIRVVPEQVGLPEGLIESLNLSANDEASYALSYRRGERSAVLIGQNCRDCPLNVQVARLDEKGVWTSNRDGVLAVEHVEKVKPGAPLSASIEVREVKRRQAFLDGKPVGDVFE
ncbi:DUF4153 domain-containing protein [Sphingomonas cavernae]|uniref:DUF4153 domain-containing protein n=1 Tax=Sphingomonas cavernae TaxID=2320861 RepID=A0A418WNP0_9SPHN|nr:DUF4153 domain-containing protein [Sphingomonas cavernae]RJF91622.1 DUF4153 domain-containing protein [Sphingomonas cavernae]